MKTKIKISGHIVRSSAAALLFLCVVVVLSSAINLPNHAPKFTTPQSNTAFGANGHDSASSMAVSAIRRNRTLMFADRVAYQRAIEDVYWRHRIWPKENAGSKPPLDKVMSQAQIQEKVEDYLRNSQALEDYWQRPITPDQLQAEMERIASNTQQPGVLREIFAALGNDPFVIAECLGRPVLAERLITELYAHDQRFHGKLKRRAEAELQTHRSVSQMKQTGSMYTEMEWIKSDSAETGSAPVDTKNIEAVKMSNSKWQESVEKLAAAFDTSRGSEAAAFGVRRLDAAFQGAHKSPHASELAQYYQTIPVGKLTQLQEDDAHYYALAVTKKGKDRLKLATVAWLKEPLRSWVARAETQLPVTMAAVSADYTLPVISSPSDACTDDTWTPTSLTNAPAPRGYHTAVWTGSEMIVWGGDFYDGSDHYLNTGGRYNPSTDSWTATSTTNAPDARGGHTAVWTGSEMIVWGGFNGNNDFNTGGRYNPSTDSWVATTTTGAPAARGFHTAVWTGSQMIIWGGEAGVALDFNTGGRYNPSTNSWMATSTTNAPDPRSGHTARWTGSEMIVWGGHFYVGEFINLKTGGRYNPSTNSWTATSTTNAPPARGDHKAVWTGSEMIVWGGFFNGPTGGRYCANGPPILITNPATLIASFSATLNGSVNPHGLTTTVYFQYGTTTSYGHTTAPQNHSGNTYQSPSVNINGLSASTIYHFRIVATNSAGTRYGSDRTFTTLSATGAPVVTSNPATFVASFSATLNGSLDPHGLTATVYFQYGTTTSYGLTTAIQSRTGNTYQNVAANISGLSANTVYHFRIVATNSAGTRFGGDRRFTTLSATGPPVVTTNPATNVVSSSATLNGSLDPHGLTTNVHFQYGTTTSYGSTTANQSKTGNTYQNVTANVASLSTGTTYHFRMVATNSAGTRYGGDRTFTTP